MKESRTVDRPPAVESQRHLPLVDLLIDARSELFELAVRSGLKVLETMLEEDRVTARESTEATPSTVAEK